jgi:hypothetical protein
MKDNQTEEQKVISISLPVVLLEQIDLRSTSLDLHRSQYLCLLAKSDLSRMGPIVLRGKKARVTKPVELTPEAYQFLLSAIPEMADFEIRLKIPDLPEPPPPPKAVTKSQLWKLFLKERDEILRYKWIQSEKEGYDIGMERAIREWLQKHHEKWAAANPAEQEKKDEEDEAED